MTMVWWPTGTNWKILHSSATGLSAMRGTFTWVDGAVVSPASAISFTLGSKSTAVTFIASASGAETRFTTNSPVDSILWSVSLMPLSGFGPQPMATTTGLSEKALKKE